MSFHIKSSVFSMCGVAIAMAGCGQSGQVGLLGGGNGGGGQNAGGIGNIGLPETVGRFVMDAGQVKQSKVILPKARIASSSSGSWELTLNPADISFTTENPASGSMEVSVAFGKVSGFGEACAHPVVSYGPFFVAVNANSQITGASGQFPVDQATVDLLTAGSYTICVTLESSVEGTAIIDAFGIQ